MSNDEIDNNTKDYTVGVIVAKLQIPEFEPSHFELFNHISSLHKTVVCFLGIPVFPSKKNPLNFNHRKQMIEENYPNIIVLPINDVRTDIEWSRNLDASIRSCVLNIGQRPLL